MKTRDDFKGWNDIDKKERIRRWERVLHVLKKMTPHEREHHFNIADWGRKTSCGTVACVAGHAGLDPWFRRRGFRINLYRGGFTRTFPIYNPDEFFGSAGYERVFINLSLRTVEQAEVGVEGYIYDLKESFS